MLRLHNTEIPSLIATIKFSYSVMSMAGSCGSASSVKKGICRFGLTGLHLLEFPACAMANPDCPPLLVTAHLIVYWSEFGPEAGALRLHANKGQVNTAQYLP